jgi:hypothetical protein
VSILLLPVGWLVGFALWIACSMLGTAHASDRINTKTKVVRNGAWWSTALAFFSLRHRQPFLDRFHGRLLGQSGDLERSVLSLAMLIWLPIGLCIYREAPDWAFLYLVPPHRATDAFLAAFFTVHTLMIPCGFLIVRLWVRGWLFQGLVFLGGTAGLALFAWAMSDRLRWVGSYADFHNGLNGLNGQWQWQWQWLLISLCLPRFASVSGSGPTAPATACAVRLEWVLLLSGVALVLGCALCLGFLSLFSDQRQKS